jgi:hypothetical protein
MYAPIASPAPAPDRNMPDGSTLLTLAMVLA